MISLVFNALFLRSGFAKRLSYLVSISPVVIGHAALGVNGNISFLGFAHVSGDLFVLRSGTLVGLLLPNRPWILRVENANTSILAGTHQSHGHAN